MTGEPPPTLSVRGLTVRYGDEPPAVSGFDFDLHAGEIVGLTGSSGAGKSTAAYALLGLCRSPGRITDGEVRLDGRNILALPEAQLRVLRGQRIALIVQNPRAALHPMRTVGDQIGAVWATHTAGGPQSRRRRRSRAVELLKEVGINDPERRSDSLAHQLSGGMAQRALIAMALAAGPEVLVADEPTSGLDVTVQAQFLDTMWRQAKTAGSAMVLVTQEPGILAHYCDRIAVMEAGRVIDACPTQDYFRRRGAMARRTVRPPLPPPETVKTPVLHVAGLAKSFPVRGARAVVQAVQSVDLTVMAGEALGLVGESGSGKTTVGRCILRLETPDDGVVRLGGHDLARLSPRALRKARAAVQFVAQDPQDSLDPRWPLGRTIAEPMRLHLPLSAAERLDAVGRLLVQVGCSPDIARRRPRELGAATLQRAAVARALATSPRFIVLDEPTSLLGPDARVALVQLLATLQAQSGVSYLFISHDLTTVAALCHRVAVMYLGQIVEVASTQALFDRPLHPYSRALLSAYLPPDPTRRRVDRPADDSLAGEIPSPIDLPMGCYLASRCPFVLERCRAEPQALVAAAPERHVRCWRAVHEPGFPPQDMNHDA